MSDWLVKLAEKQPTREETIQQQLAQVDLGDLAEAAYDLEPAPRLTKLSALMSFADARGRELAQIHGAELEKNANVGLMAQKALGFAMKRPGIAGAAVGAGLGALQNPGTDPQTGQQNSRLGNMVTGGLMGGAAGALGGGMLSKHVLGGGLGKGVQQYARGAQRAYASSGRASAGLVAGGGGPAAARARRAAPAAKAAPSPAAATQAPAPTPEAFPAMGGGAVPHTAPAGPALSPRNGLMTPSAPAPKRSLFQRLTGRGQGPAPIADATIPNQAGVRPAVMGPDALHHGALDSLEMAHPAAIPGPMGGGGAPWRGSASPSPIVRGYKMKQAHTVSFYKFALAQPRR